MQPDIADPKVLFVTFEKLKDGEWYVKIPHAYGKDQHYIAPVSEKLSLQFQPAPLIAEVNGEEHVKVNGVICYPLTEIEKSDVQ